MIRLRLLFFARSRELAGCKETELEVPAGSDSSVLSTAIVAAFPALRELLGHSVISVNQEYVGKPVLLHNNDEIAVIPPISGG
eukprot:tig00021036_g17289.t1